jgi:hypothetical protein
MSTSNEHPDFTRRFYDVFRAELLYIQKRRKSLGLDPKHVIKERERLGQAIEEAKKKGEGEVPDPERQTPQTDIRPDPDAGLVGLALSGGGIRSATFNLGLLQGLAREGVLRFCDYLSTVSGGGYIGSCLSSLLDNPSAAVQDMRDEAGNKKHFPFRFERAEKPDERKETKHLRRYSNYLALNRSLFSLDTWRMIGNILSGLVLTNIAPFALGVIIAYFLYRSTLSVRDHPFIFAVPLLQISLFVFIAMVTSRAWAASKNLGYEWRRRFGYLHAALALSAALLAAGAGLIVLTVHLPKVKEEVYDILNGISLASILGLGVGLLKSENKTLKKLLPLIFRIALIALLPVLFAQLLRLLWATDAFEIIVLGKSALLGLPILIWVAIALLVISLFINTNRISLHHFYRDRLSEAYIIKRVKKDENVEVIESNETLTLKDLHRNLNGPYHLINVTLNVPSSKDRYLRGRGADLFMFSKLFCGAESTGYRNTKTYEKGDIHLATAMAISGAAASPQMGHYTSPILAFIMTLFNVRLNRWMANPEPQRTPLIRIWPYYFVKELLCQGKETDSLINLSDGGHHENLGIYPLLKRRCKVIIASDAAGDPGFKMADLANLQRKARIDLGIDIDMPNEGNLCPDPEKRYTKKHYLRGTISYPDGKEGVLFYIKSTLTGYEPEDLLAYRRNNPDFPDQTTADQFFDEAQFESYRKLGEIATLDTLREEEIISLLESWGRIR